METRKLLLRENNGIIIAADVDTLPELRYLSEVSRDVHEVVAIKVGFSLALRFGLERVVKTVKEACSLPIIYDHQKAATDIPGMGQPFAEICRDATVKGVILFPHAGPKTLEAFVMAIFEYELTPIVGLVMTHPAYLKSDGGFIADDAPSEICKIAVDLGVRSFVLPGNKPKVTHKFSQGPLMSVAPTEIMMPGIGTQGGAIGEAFESVKGHHAFAIIGSAIYSAPDPRKSLELFAAEVRK